MRTLVLCLIVIGSVLTLNTQNMETREKREAENVFLLKRFYNDVVNGGNLSEIDNIWAPDMLWQMGSTVITGREAYKEMSRASIDGSFTEMHLEVLDIFAADDKVVVRFTNSGLNTGKFNGLGPSGKRAKWNGIGIYRIENNMIAEAWFNEDFLDMYQQLNFIKELPSPVVQHVNCWWLKDPNNEEDVRKLREAVENMRVIPGIIDIQFGPRTKAEWTGGTEPTFDYAFVVTFESEEAIKEYQPHPLHLKTIEITNTICEKYYYFYFNSNMPE